MKRKRHLLVEFIVLFCLVPLVLYGYRFLMAPRIVGIMVLVGSACLLYLIKNPAFHRETFWCTKQWRRHLRNILITFAIAAPVLGVLACLFIPERLFSFPRDKPIIWGMVIMLYPLLAAYPQEIIFRGFFFERYAALFPRPVSMIAVNAACFAATHLFYGNWVAPVLSVLGGVLFAYRYHQTRSLLMVGIEHALWGNYLFTIGIGWYFHSGSLST